MDKSTLKLIIETIFGVIESKQTGLAKLIIGAIRKSVIANLDEILSLFNAQMAAKAAKVAKTTKPKTKKK